MRKLIILLLLLPLLSKAQSPYFACGFECGIIPKAAASDRCHWSASSGSETGFSISTTTVRTGSRSLRVNLSSQSNQGSIETGSRIAGFPSGNFSVCVVYINVSTAPNNDQLLVYTGSTNAAAGLGYKNADGKVYAAFNNSSFTFGSTGTTLSAGWHRVDIKVNGNANPWLIDVKVDGTDLGQASWAVASSTPGAFSLGSYSSTTMDVYYDDFTVSNTSGDYPIGASYVSAYTVTSDGSHNVAGAGDFAHGTAGADITNSTTDAWTLIDDIPMVTSITTTDLVNILAPPNAGDYVQCVMNPAVSTAPKFVDFLIAIHQAGTGAGNMEVRLNDNGSTTNIYTATGLAGTTTLRYKTGGWFDPPSAASTWTLSGNGNFNNVQIRIGSPAAVDANPDQYVDAFMVEAMFIEQAPLPHRIKLITQNRFEDFKNYTR